MEITRKTGYVFEELYMWHDAGNISFMKWVQPGEIWENQESKRRIHNLLVVSGLYEKLTHIKARYAIKDEILMFHTESYHDRIVSESKLSKGGDGGEQCRFGQGGYEIAALSCGGILSAIDSVMSGAIENAYCLIRPPGHHAIADKGMGFCIFNNIVIGAKYAKKTYPNIKRVAIVDYDVHHGNGTQAAFWDDPETLFISLHQDNNYPQGIGSITEIGGDEAKGSTINLPLPPGSGTGAYYYAFDTVVIPALKRFQPDIILVSSGFDCSYADPLGAMMISSEGFGVFASKLVDAATELCHGRLIFTHEGGYSKDYVPFCGLAVVESLVGIKTTVEDPYLNEARNWGYQSLQQHQKLVIDTVASLVGLTPIPSSSTITGESNLEPEEKLKLDIMEKILLSVSDPSCRKLMVEALVTKISK